MGSGCGYGVYSDSNKEITPGDLLFVLKEPRDFAIHPDVGELAKDLV